MKEDKYEKKGKYPLDRSITDFICCVVFLAATGFSIFLAIYGFSKGSLKNIMQPYDSSGSACGRDKLTDYKYLYLTTVNPKEWTKKNACVKECPASSESKVECSTNGQITDCGLLPADKTYNFAKRFCIPTGMILKNANTAATTADATSASKFSFGDRFKTFQKEAYGDVVDSWKIFLVSILVAIIISILYLFLLEKCAIVIILGMIIAMIAALGLLGWMFFKNYRSLQEDKDPSNDNDKMYLYLSWVTWGVAGVLVCCFCCFFSQINLASKIIAATADYITDYSRIIIVPILTLTMLVAYLLWWGYSGAYLFSIGDLKYNGQYPWGEVKWDKKQT